MSAYDMGLYPNPRAPHAIYTVEEEEQSLENRAMKWCPACKKLSPIIENKRQDLCEFCGSSL